MVLSKRLEEKISETGLKSNRRWMFLIDKNDD
jgi:hypothetical protein